MSADILRPVAAVHGALDVARLIDEDAHYALFLLTGNIDEPSAPRLLDHLVSAARLTEVDLVIVDLIRVEFLGGAGANCLDAAWRAAGRLDTQVVLTRPSAFVRRILRVTGLDRLVAEDVEPWVG